MNNLNIQWAGYANAFTQPDTNGESEQGINKNLDLCAREGCRLTCRMCWGPIESMWFTDERPCII